MAYLSDIDLATLHKKRLEEKLSYKLSWYNRRFYDEDYRQETHSSIKAEKHKAKSKVSAIIEMTTKQSKEKAPSTTQQATDNESVEKGNNDRKLEISDRNHCSNVYDEGYFSAPSLNRRRSGTWP